MRGSGEVGFAHLFLGGRDIVGDAIVADGTLVTVIDGVVGGGVPVSGLAYAAGIYEERPFAQFDWYTDGKFLELAAHGGRVDAAEERDMGVADQAMAGLQVFEAGEGGGLGDKVLPYRVPRSAVGEGENSRYQGQGQPAEIIHMLLGQLSLGPQGCEAGVRVEFRGVDLSNGSPIVVAGDGDVVVLPEEVDDFTGVWAIADDVAEAPELVDGAAGLGVG